MSDPSRSTRPPVILVANDQEWSLRSLESVLSPQGFAVLRAYTGLQALDLAVSARPDAVILDIRLPDIDGIALCRKMREQGQLAPNTPIILTTAETNVRALRSAAYAEGAWEFCTEPIDIDVLVPKLQTFVNAKLAAERMIESSLIDPETGLYNARGMVRRAREIGAEVIRRSDALACIAFTPEEPRDPGAREGSPALAEHVSRICRAQARVSDVVGRLGPSEFAIIAPSTESLGAERLAERLRDSVESTPFTVEGRERSIRLHIAHVAVTNLAEATHDALELLYRATAGLRRERGLSLPNTLDRLRASAPA